MDRLSLPTVALCAATSVNLPATLAAMQRCLALADFADAILFSDARPADLDPAIRYVPIDRLNDAQAYSRFMIRRLPAHIASAHCLIVQWDGFIVDPAAWDPRFLEYDYIGAEWPQFGVDRVGNGGFSLRSRKLLQALADPEFCGEHPEDVVICRTNRALLESRHGIRFANPATADRFSYERSKRRGPTFGFHGVFNLPDVIGPDGFWQTYLTLDSRGAVFHDFWLLVRSVLMSRGGAKRAIRLAWDYMSAAFPRRQNSGGRRRQRLVQ